MNVCLIRWEDDELLVKSELDRLHDVFEKMYGFNTEIWLIPRTASQFQLTKKTCAFIEEFDNDNNLFIVYHGGHSKINDARQNQWCCTPHPESPCINWSAIQVLFREAVSEVLVLLDCCAAASSAPGSGPGVMEAIGACGFETRAPPPGKYSFTHTLIEVLEDWVDKPSFSAAMLHTEVLFVLKEKRPERGRDGRRLEWCATPIHSVYTGNPKAPGIELCSLKSMKTSQKRNIREEIQRPTSYVDAMELDDGDPSQNPLTACTSNGNYQIPHVLISIALEEDQETLDARSCQRWLSQFPEFAKYAIVEGVYKGNSTLVTLSLPVMIWDLLPEHPACSFIGFVNSPSVCVCHCISGSPASRCNHNNMQSQYDRLEYDKISDDITRMAPGQDVENDLYSGIHRFRLLSLPERMDALYVLHQQMTLRQILSFIQHLDQIEKESQKSLHIKRVHSAQSTKEIPRSHSQPRLRKRINTWCCCKCGQVEITKNQIRCSNYACTHLRCPNCPIEYI